MLTANINSTVGDGVTTITYSGVHDGRPKTYSYTVVGEFTKFEQNENSLTLK